MSLDKAALKTALQRMMDDLSRADDDDESVWFGDDVTPTAAAERWAAALGAYAAGVVPASTTVGAAQGALETALASAFAAPAAAPGMETAFAAFAVTVGGGMAGAGFTGTPPASPVGFAALFATAPTGNSSDAAQALADLVHDWMSTGTATLIAPPNTVTPWS